MRHDTDFTAPTLTELLLAEAERKRRAELAARRRMAFVLLAVSAAFIVFAILSSPSTTS
jgi:hypothetical protein